MARLIERRGLNQRVVALFPAGAALGEWYPLQNGVQGLLRDNGSIDLRSRVRLTAPAPDPHGGNRPPQWKCGPPGSYPHSGNADPRGGNQECVDSVSIIG